MKRSQTRFLPTFLTLVTVVLAGFTAASVQQLLATEARGFNPATFEALLANAWTGAAGDQLGERLEQLARVAATNDAERDIASRRVVLLGAALFAALGFLVFSLLAAERNARQLLRMARTSRTEADRARAQLVEAVENISEGFVLYDNDDRLVLCNRKFREAYKIVADILQPGVTSEEILRAATERGQFPQAIVDKEQWIANRLAQRRRFDPPFEQQLAGGRWHMVSDRATRDGGLVGIRTDITELKRREFELRDARQSLELQAERMRALAEETQNARAVLQDAIESINEGFCLFDSRDTLVMCNSRYLDLHENIRQVITPGATFSEITRAAIESGSLIVDEPPGAAIAKRERIREDLEDASFEEQFSGDRWIRVSTRRMRNRGIVSVYADISEMKQREFALTSAQARLERQAQDMTGLADAAQRANRAKSEFLAMMSHEIRTPLNGVISALHLLRDQALMTEDRRLVSTARSGAQSLLTILNDILDMSKIEAGMLELDASPFRIREVIDNVVALCQPQAESSGLTLRIEVSDNIAEFVLGDAGRLRQMTLNYLSNAIKFTETGIVEILVEPVGNVGELIHFEVTDTGIGIPHDKQGQVFRDFVQLDQSIRRRHGGTGLGLAITRRLARLMGGAVGFKSEPGHGSTFWFDIPLPRTQAPTTHESSTAEEYDHFDSQDIKSINLKVLLAEDNETNAYLAKLLLQRMGCTVDTVYDGAQALESSVQHEYDAIFMDISMPVMDGLEATRRIRASGYSMPVIALSANTGPQFEVECRSAGMIDCLTKPINLAALRRCIEAIVTAKGNRSDRQEAHAFVASSALESVFEELGPAAFQRIVASCHKDISAELDAMLEAWRNVAGAGDENMRRAAHKLVSLAATIGANELARLARLVEADGARASDAETFESIARDALKQLDENAERLTTRAA